MASAQTPPERQQLNSRHNQPPHLPTPKICANAKTFEHKRIAKLPQTESRIMITFGSDPRRKRPRQKRACGRCVRALPAANRFPTLLLMACGLMCELYVQYLELIIFRMAKNKCGVTVCNFAISTRQLVIAPSRQQIRS